MERVGFNMDSVGTLPMPGGMDEEVRIAVPTGEARLGDLRIGDLVCMRDGSARPLTALHPVRLPPESRQGPVAVARGVLGARHLLRLCGDQQILLSGWLVAALFSGPEVLARIGAFRNGDHVSDADAGGRYLLPELARPGLICGNGLWLAAASQSGGTARPLLSADEEAGAAESGLFSRRRGESNARTDQRGIGCAA